MTRLEVEVARDGRSRRPRDEVWRDVSSVPAIAACLPAVRSCVPSGDRWRWELATYRALGFEVTPAFDVEASFEPPSLVRFRPVGEVSEDAEGEGSIRLAEVAGGTDVRVRVRIEVDVPVPRLLARPLAAVLRQEVSSVLDDLLARLA